MCSTDADGVVKLWDIRIVGESAHFTCPTGQSANDGQFDRSGTKVAVACDDGNVYVYSTIDGQIVGALEGHTDSVQAVIVDPNGQYAMSAAADATFRLWR